MNQLDTVLCHFYNEEYLLPWWLNHHKKLFKNGIMVDYNSTDNSRKIIEEICPHWKIVNSRNEEFSTSHIDHEIMDLERSLPENTWRICLNVTEFLILNQDLHTELKLKSEVRIQTVSMVDDVVNSNKFPTYDKPLIDQCYYGFINGESNLDREFELMTCRNYMYRSLHNYNIHYPNGRHFKDKENITENAWILWYGFSPFNDELLKRRLQIQNRIPQIDKDRNFGWQHITTKEMLENALQKNQPYVKNFKDFIGKYYNFIE